MISVAGVWKFICQGVAESKPAVRNIPQMVHRTRIEHTVRTFPKAGDSSTCLRTVRGSLAKISPRNIFFAVSPPKD